MAAHLRLYWSVVVHAEFNCPKHALPVGFPAKHRVTGRLFVEYFQNRIREIAGDVLRAVFVPQFDHLFVTAGRIIQVRVSEYLTRWGPGLLRLGAIMSFGGYCVSRPGLLRLGAVVG